MWFFIILCISLANGFVMFMFYNAFKDKTVALKEELSDIRYVMELEWNHYTETDTRREELAKIRHDFNNHLASISQFLPTGGGHETVREMVASLADDIKNTAENVYCGIPIVNAVLTEKAKSCGEKGILLEVRLDLPPEISIEKLHICSLFHNLLDNAINACGEIRDEKPLITLTSLCDGDYLFIKTVNPSVTPPKKPALGRGYGTRILTDIAERYEGEYRAEYRDGIFTAVVSLLAA